MLRVTIDAFSGRANPETYLDDKESTELLKEIARERNVVTAVEAGEQGLGFRGVIIEAVDDDTVHRYDLPTTFKLAGGASHNEKKAQELAERLIKKVTSAPQPSGLTLGSQVETQLLELLAASPAHEHHGELDGEQAAVSPSATCAIELGAFNPGFWNASAYMGRNNCYNYASNKRTNTFAQPGRGSGHMYTGISCPAVTTAALSDRLHRRFDCFPDAQKPRWLVALVMAPGYDYHWYRKQKEGFWGHKPGGTAARNVDNNGSVILNPETCARGPYTQFCGYFYVPGNQLIS
ncbi:MAG TPA: hypothetical protein VI299_07580 [Polyangiales bacterium]